MSRLFGWDYPPGVTGLEPEIAGWPPCGNCGHDSDDHTTDDPAVNWCQIDWCDCTEYDQYQDDVGPDPDEVYDRKREERLGI